MITRRQIRIKAMQALYAHQLTGDNPAEVFKNNLQETYDILRDTDKKGQTDGDSGFLMRLFYDTITHEREFDKMIENRAQNWELGRMATIDRIIMHQALFEILYQDQYPIKVSINEYLDIAKEFSTPKSSQFINGILDTIQLSLKEEGKIIKTGRGLIENSPTSGNNEKETK